MQWVMLGAVQWSIRVIRWWIMQMVNRLNVILTQYHVQNAVELGEQPEKPAYWPV